MKLNIQVGQRFLDMVSRTFAVPSSGHLTGFDREVCPLVEAVAFAMGNWSRIFACVFLASTPKWPLFVAFSDLLLMQHFYVTSQPS